MEIEGHPTQDILEELERRGAVRILGSSGGPPQETTAFLTERFGDVDGLWIFVPRETFMTGLDDPLV
jgi:hypothetical protein